MVSDKSCIWAQLGENSPQLVFCKSFLDQWSDFDKLTIYGKLGDNSTQQNYFGKDAWPN